MDDKSKDAPRDWEDTELIECAKCHAPLNGKSLWVLADGKTLCEYCYHKAMMRKI